MRLDLGQRKRAGTNRRNGRAPARLMARRAKREPALARSPPGRGFRLRPRAARPPKLRPACPEAARRTLALDLRVPGTVPLPTTRMRLRTGRAPMRAPG